MSLAVGIDVGGTKLAAALVDTRTGEVRTEARTPTEPRRGAGAVLADCVALAGEVAAGMQRVAVGIGVCELVDRDGRIGSAVTVDWRDVDVAGAFSAFGPARVDSDIRAQARAECAFGAARGRGSALVVTVSTGISHCLVLAGEPWAGARGNAICTGAPLVEEVAGGLALARRAGRERAEDVLADPTLDALVDDAARALGQELARLVNALDPEVLVIAGGLGLVDAFRARAVDAMRPLVFSPATARLQVVPAELGATAGVIGAALAAPGGDAVIALLFDMDGVLVDSHAVAERVMLRWAAREGVPADAVLARMHGRRSEDIVRELAPHLDAVATAIALDREELAEEGGVLAVPGAAALLPTLPDDGWAVVTSATRELALARLPAAGLPLPRVLVTADDVPRGKPDPAGYRAAAARLGAPPRAAVVIEDAPAGIEAARRAGLLAIGVTTTLAADALLAAGAAAAIADLRALPRALEGLEL